jgi:DNA polymerase-3 subunit alpha
MGKKDPKAMAEQRNRFITGAAKLGHPKAAVDEIFEQMAKFSGYGFNKSHSAAYALVAYQTAYLKTHYPVEFMAALLTSETSKPDSVVKYIGECREMDIRVEPPDVQVSGAQFTPHTIEDRQAVRFGLAAVKNVGGNAIESILKARAEAGGRFKSFWEFCEKVDLRLMNKRVIESLIKAGALDSLGTRGQLMAAVDKAMERAQKTQRDAEQGQSGLFGLFDETPARGREADALPVAADWEESEQVCRKAAQPDRRDHGGRGAGAQAAGAAVGRAGGRGGRDSGGGNHSWAARAEEPARSAPLRSGFAGRCDGQNRVDLLCARLRAAGAAAQDRGARAGARHADGR